MLLLTRTEKEIFENLSRRNKVHFCETNFTSHNKTCQVYNHIVFNCIPIIFLCALISCGEFQFFYGIILFFFLILTENSSHTLNYRIYRTTRFIFRNCPHFYICPIIVETLESNRSETGNLVTRNSHHSSFAIVPRLNDTSNSRVRSPQTSQNFGKPMSGSTPPSKNGFQWRNNLDAAGRGRTRGRASKDNSRQTNFASAPVRR